MSRNSSGTYSLPLPPVTPGTLITATWANTTLADIAQAITDSLDREGRGGMNAPLRVDGGTAVNPGFAFNAGPSTGMYSTSASALEFSVLGVKIGEFNANGLTITPPGVLEAETIDVNALEVGGNLTMATGGQILADDGTLALPAYSFASDPDSGFYKTSTTIRVSLQGVNTMQFRGTDTVFLLPSLAANGTAAEPSWSFINDSDSGLFRIGANTLGFSTAGLEAWRVDGNQIFIKGETTAQGVVIGATAVTPVIQVHGSSFGTSGQSLTAWANSTLAPSLFLAKSRGAAPGTYTVVQDGDIIGRISFNAADGFNMAEGARIAALVDGVPGVNDMPLSLVFYTASDGSASVSEVMRMTPANRLLIGSSTSTNTQLGGSNIAAQVQNHGLSTSPASIAQFQWGAGGGPVLSLNHSNGATVGSYTVITDGSILGRISFAGSDGTAFAEGARITAMVNGVPGANDMPGSLLFATTSDGGEDPVERLRITSDARFMFNNTADPVAMASTTPIAQFHSTSTSGATVGAYCWTASAASAAGGFQFARSRGGLNVQTAVLSNDTLGRVGFYGSDGSAFVEAARIEARAESGIGAGDVPGRMLFYTSPDGGSLTERWRIDSDGRLISGGVAGQTTRVGASSITPYLQENGTSNETSALGLFCWAAGTSSNHLFFSKSRGAAIGTATIVVDGDPLGRICWTGNDGTNFIEAARISAVVEGTPGANDMPGSLLFGTTADGASAPTTRLTIMPDGRIFGANLHNNSGAVTGTTSQYIASGTYVPVATLVTNLDSSSGWSAQWIRVGNVVTVSGTGTVNATASETFSQLRLTLPIASNLAAVGDLGGAGATGIAASGEMRAVRIIGDTVNDAAQVNFFPDSDTSETLSFTFTYEVL